MIELNPLLNKLLDILNEKKNHIQNCIIKVTFIVSGYILRRQKKMSTKP